MLVSAGYYRARLNITPFDKVLGGMCWAITGSNVDIDIEFEDDMTMGEKIVMCDKVCQAISKMECPTPIAPHQISGLDFERILQVMPWLIQKLALSRDSRASFVRRQGLLNYNRAFVKDAERGDEDGADFPADDGRILELATMKDLVFRGKPKRVYLAQNNLDEAPFFDARRVHQCLKEYNDTSANAVFEYMLA